MMTPGVEMHQEARENLRIIRELMERSTKYSTFSGFSGVLAGLTAIGGCLVQYIYVSTLYGRHQKIVFLTLWVIVVATAISIDYLLTKRRAPMVGKTIISRLGRQMFEASVPGLSLGAFLTVILVRANMTDWAYPFWMLSYGTAVSAVGLFSQREVGRLGRAFLVAGVLTFALDTCFSASIIGKIGLLMTAVSFGGFHIIYGIGMAKHDGW